MLEVGVNLLVLTGRPPAGTGYHAINLFEALVRTERPDVAVTGFATREAAHYLSPRARARLHLLPSGARWDRPLNELLRLPMAALRRGIDVMVNPAFLGVPWGSPRRALIIHDLYFCSDPELVPMPRRYLLRAVTPWLARASDPLFAVSEATKRQIAKHYPALARRTSVLLSGNRPLLGRPATVPPSSRPFLLMVGTLTPNKFPEVAVAALAVLRGLGHDLALVHVGDDCGRLAPLAAASGMTAHVSAIGRQSDDVLLTHYAHCVALVLPSIREGFGLPLIEGQAQGAPVIASRCEALLEIGRDTVLYFSGDDPASLVDAVRTLLEDSERRAALIEAGRINAAGFNWDRTAAELLAALA